MSNEFELSTKAVATGTSVYFTSIPYLTTSYDNVIDFATESAKLKWFNSNHKKMTLNANIKYDGTLEYLIVPKHISEVSKYDYLWYKGYEGQYYYYFITDVKYNTSNTTILFLSLDVFTTFWNKVTVGKSFIEREHVNRWTTDGRPFLPNVDEGLAIGHYELKGYSVVGELEKAVIIASSVPMGVIEKAIGGMGATSGGDWNNGLISAMGFRFIKGFEGFAPYEYQDSGGYWTIAYGVTKHGEPSIYSELASSQPVSEEAGAKVSYQLKCDNYGSPIVSRCKELGITKQCQFDALVSLAYNCGTGVITKSNSLTDAIKNSPNDESVIRPIWENFYVTSNGTYLEGLHLRRIEECNMFFGQEFEVRAITTFNSSGVADGTVTENDGNGWLPTDNAEGAVGDYDGHVTIKNELGDNFLCPVCGAYISSPYGYRWHPISGTYKMHWGVDLACDEGTPILADRDGTIVTKAYQADGAGRYITLQCDNGIQTLFMHCSVIHVEEGDVVKRGQLIAEVGSTGASTGNHLHWEFRTVADGRDGGCNPMPDYETGDRV